MTKKEEAKKYLIDISYTLGNLSVEYLTEKHGKKMRDAIETLWQQPCEDTISREAAIHCLEQLVTDMPQLKLYAQKVADAMSDLSPVYPKQKWTPVSEKPKEMGSYMTTLDYGEYGLVAGQRYYHGEDIGWSDECVIAWMPLPEPYKPQESER